MIVCGACHNIILNENNELFICGYNRFGQLGLGDKKNRNQYVKLNHNFGNVKNIFCNGDHNIILNENNELFVCGYNDCGQLGLGDNKDRNKYVKLNNNFGKIKNICCGGYHNIILNENDEFFVCGWNEFGQLGLGNKKNRNQYVKLDIDFDIFIKKQQNFELELCLDNIIL